MAISTCDIDVSLNAYQSNQTVVFGLDKCKSADIEMCLQHWRGFIKSGLKSTLKLGNIWNIRFCVNPVYFLKLALARF